MTPEAWTIVTIGAVVLFLMSVGAWIYAARVRRQSAGTDGRRTSDELASMRSNVDNIKDRNGLLEERFERYERTQRENRDAIDKMRQEVDARLNRVTSQDSAQRELQDQLHEIRKEHQVLMERDERHERRVLELQEQLGTLRTERAPSRNDGRRSRA